MGLLSAVSFGNAQDYLSGKDTGKHAKAVLIENIGNSDGSNPLKVSGGNNTNENNKKNEEP